MVLAVLAISYGDISLGDETGFLALIAIGLSSIFMLVRSKVLKVTKNLAAIRVFHIAISVAAGVFLVFHVASLFAPPVSLSMDMGYVAVAVSVAVWLSGTAFLERLRDSLFFHGVLSSVLVGVIMVHAATSSVNIPFIFSEIMLGTTLLVMFANAAYHLIRAVSHA